MNRTILQGMYVFSEVIRDCFHTRLGVLLNTIMDGPTITEVTLLDTNHPYVMSENGSSTFDVYCECDDKSEIIVEMQKCNECNFEDRAFAYSAMAVMDQAWPKWDYRFNQVCFIGIATFNLFKAGREYSTTRSSATRWEERSIAINCKSLSDCRNLRTTTST